MGLFHGYGFTFCREINSKGTLCTLCRDCRNTKKKHGRKCHSRSVTKGLLLVYKYIIQGVSSLRSLTPFRDPC